MESATAAQLLAEPEFAAGQYVMAKWGRQAKLYDGKIQQYNGDGTYTVLWTRWRNTSSVAAGDIQEKPEQKENGMTTGSGVCGDQEKAQASAEQKDGYAVGDACYARWKNSAKEYKGKVKKVNGDGSFEVFWPEWNNSTTCWATDMRPREKDPIDLLQPWEKPLRWGEIVINCELHQEMVPGIIGKGGNFINNLRRTTNSRINVQAAPTQEEKNGKNHVTGEELFEKLKLISSTVDDTPEPSKGDYFKDDLWILVDLKADMEELEKASKVAKLKTDIEAAEMEVINCEANIKKVKLLSPNDELKNAAAKKDHADAIQAKNELGEKLKKAEEPPEPADSPSSGAGFKKGGPLPPQASTHRPRVVPIMTTNGPVMMQMMPMGGPMGGGRNSAFGGPGGQLPCPPPAAPQEDLRLVTIAGPVEGVARAVSGIAQKIASGSGAPFGRMKILIPDEHCGWLIGKGGSQLKEVKGPTCARIDVAKEAKDHPDLGTSAIFMITCLPQDFGPVIHRFARIMDRLPKKQNQQGPDMFQFNQGQRGNGWGRTDQMSMGKTVDWLRGIVTGQGPQRAADQRTGMKRKRGEAEVAGGEGWTNQWQDPNQVPLGESQMETGQGPLPPDPNDPHPEKSAAWGAEVEAEPAAKKQKISDEEAEKNEKKKAEEEATANALAPKRGGLRPGVDKKSESKGKDFQVDRSASPESAKKKKRSSSSPKKEKKRSRSRSSGAFGKKRRRSPVRRRSPPRRRRSPMRRRRSRTPPRRRRRSRSRDKKKSRSKSASSPPRKKKRSASPVKKRKKSPSPTPEKPKAKAKPARKKKRARSSSSSSSSSS